MLGALAKLGLLPFSREDFTEVLTSTLPSDKVSINLDAFDSAADLMQA
jgi:Pyruvate/2-oxoacid:ferredoxin oxidoreductase gamma subunit